MNVPGNIPRLSAADAASFAGARPPAGGPPDKVREMTQQFEAVFVRHLLNEAQKPVIGGGAIQAS
ncbi:MAG: hypothetical protein ACKOKG_04845, partial [Verrucomicrobiota bacterium]